MFMLSNYYESFQVRIIEVMFTVLGQLLRGELPPNPTRNANPKPNPKSDQGAIFLGGNCLDTHISYKSTSVTIFLK